MKIGSGYMNINTLPKPNTKLINNQNGIKAVVEDIKVELNGDQLIFIRYNDRLSLIQCFGKDDMYMDEDTIIENQKQFWDIIE